MGTEKSWAAWVGCSGEGNAPGWVLDGDGQDAEHAFEKVKIVSYCSSAREIVGIRTSSESFASCGDSRVLPSPSNGP